MSTQNNSFILDVVNETLGGINIPASYESLNSGFLNPDNNLYTSCLQLVHQYSPLSHPNPLQFAAHQGFNRRLTSAEMMAQTQNCNTTKMLTVKTTVADMLRRQLNESEDKKESAVHTMAHSIRAASGRQRIRWTYELHEQFVEAVNTLGGPMKATPKEILKLMKTDGLTIFHIKSHLQKYRTTKLAENMIQGKNERTVENEGLTSYALEYGKLQISETLRLQWELQKSLHDHLEFQRKLQMRIEVHANYLERMFEQQKRGCSFNDTHHKKELTKLAEFSSFGEQQYPSKIASEIGSHKEKEF